MVATANLELNVSSLLSATNEQLKFWIGEVNDTAGLKGKKALAKSGKKEVLQQRLATHYGFDLSVAPPLLPPPAVPAPSTTTSYGGSGHTSAHLAVSAEYDGAAAANTAMPVVLLQEIRGMLGSLQGLAAWAGATTAGVQSNTPDVLDMTCVPSETVFAMMRATECRNKSAVSKLQQLLKQSMLPAFAPPVPPPPPLSGVVPSSALQQPGPPHADAPFIVNGVNMRSTDMLAMPPQRPFALPTTPFTATSPPMSSPYPLPSSPSLLSSPSLSARVVTACCPIGTVPAADTGHQTVALAREAALLAACEVKIKVLKSAKNLHEAIAQVEDGLVQEMRDEYGPLQGRKAHPRWNNMKTTINCHECLYEQFACEFKADKKRFFTFFSVESHKRKRGGKGGTGLRPSRPIADAIPLMQKGIADERQKPEYVDAATGQFLQDI
ncbi:hypothetical protein EWM64_g2502 [Hericium alpestre]|uniref:Uncharacterized protein n=1 Tax=Hericium alpestre TaxID=135208 RepID=A0A4Z0A6I4_9AGAM|nr:hypothetical protein EWM64_g2502 [Hericium alpestre]